jgi:hypothetical protein
MNDHQKPLPEKELDTVSGGANSNPLPPGNVPPIPPPRIPTHPVPPPIKPNP